MGNKGYFKGWYFKCCTENKTIAFIPAYHGTGRTVTASLQIITDNTAYAIPVHTIRYREKPLHVELDGCTFSEKGIALDLRNKGLPLEGTLRFQALSPIRYDIMGPFALVPFMQCRHRVYSMMHRVDGRITLGGEEFVFQKGVGYIEGDRGYSFPRRYLWTQCCFEKGSLMLSVADIPFCGLDFTGIIGVVLWEGREYRLASYLGAQVKQMGKNTVAVRQGDLELVAELLEKNSQPLLAPTNGRMSRTIHESASCKAYYRFSFKNKILLEFTSDKAGFEYEYDL